MSDFDRDRNEVIERALASGVNTIITVGTDLESSRKAIEISETHPEVLATVGFHPHEASRVTENSLIDLARLAAHPRVVAIGEIGLDFYRNRSPREIQLRVLKQQLGLSIDVNLPVIIHCRRAESDMFPLLSEWALTSKSKRNRPPGVIHCFSGDIDTARRYLEMGFFISFGGYIGYPSSLNLHSVIKSIPPDRYVVETDCPFLPPQPYRGKRNEPAYVTLTVETIARIRQISPETVARETTRNALSLFKPALR